MLIMTTFSDWLQLKFEEWEKSRGRRRQSYTAFARYLGVTQPSLNRWLMGDVLPDAKSVQILSEKLGYEIYDVLNIEPPYPRIAHELTAAYNTLDAEQQEEFQRRIQKTIEDYLREHGFKRVK